MTTLLKRLLRARTRYTAPRERTVSAPAKRDESAPANRQIARGTDWTGMVLSYEDFR